jgi:hypothetical protein
VIQPRRLPGIAPGLPRIALALVFLGLPASRGEADGGQADAPTATALWRRPENDGRNCLFLQLRHLGYPGRYEDYLRAVADRPGLDQLGGLSAAAKELGYDLVTVRLTMAELERSRTPTIVHLEWQDRETGYFGLVVGFGRDDASDHVILIHGGMATVDAMPRDAFRREWGGYALVPPRESGWGPWIRRGTAALMIALAVVAAGSVLFKPDEDSSMVRSRPFERSCRPAFLIGVLAFSGGRSVAAEPAIPDEVRAALRENGEQLSPVTITYTRKLTTRIGRQEVLERLRLKHRKVDDFFFESKHRMSWQDGKIHTYQTQYMPGDSAAALEDEASFDGKVLYSGRHGAVQATLFKRWMSKVMKDEPASQYLRQDYLRAAGIHFPMITEWDHPRAKSVVLYQLENEGVLESVEKEGAPGGELLRVTLVAPGIVKESVKNVDLKKEEELLKVSRETPARQKELIEALRRQLVSDPHRFVYYLDPAQHYAVVRWEEWERRPSRLVRRYENSRFQQLAGRQVRLPQHSEIRIHQFAHMPGTYVADSFLSEVFEVSAMDTATISDDRFVLAFNDPGTYIRDGTLPEAEKDPEGYISYTIPARMADLDDVIRRARNGEQFSPFLPPRPTSGLTQGFIIANVVVFAAIVGYIVYRFGFRGRSAKGGT